MKHHIYCIKMCFLKKKLIPKHCFSSGTHFKINYFIKVPFNLLYSITTKICLLYFLGLASFSKWFALFLILNLLSTILLALFVGPHVIKLIIPVMINGQTLLRTWNVSMFLAFYFLNNLILTSFYIWGKSGIWQVRSKF